MTKEIAKALNAKVEEAAKNFSRTDRECSNGEKFEVGEIIPLSEYSAMANLSKDSGKKVI